MLTGTAAPYLDAVVYLLKLVQKYLALGVRLVRFLVHYQCILGVNCVDESYYSFRHWCLYVDMFYIAGIDIQNCRR
jgi:hypothetical protein